MTQEDQVGWVDPNDADEDDEYFSELDSDDIEYTGKEPRFLKIDSLETPPAELSALGVDKLIEMYRAERDQLATDRKGYKAREARVKLHLSIISMVLRDRADLAGGVDTFATPSGTAFRNKKEFFKVSDWTDFSSYVLKTGNVQLLQKRVSPNAVKELREAEGQLPPGIENRVEVEFSVRSPTARKRKS